MNIDTLLKHTDPAAAVPPYSDGQRRQILDDVVSSKPASRPRKLLRWAAVAAAILVAGFGGWNVFGWVGMAQANDVLTRAAINATDPPATASQYWKLTTSGTITHEFDSTLCLMNFTDVEYVAVDGSRPSWHVRGKRTVNQRIHGSEDCESQRPAEIWTSDLSPNDYPDGGYFSPTAEFIASLPRDVEALRKKLYDDNGDKGSFPDRGVYFAIADLLRTGMAPADLRSSLFEVLKTLPVGKTGERVVNGRTLVSLGYRTITGWGDEVLIDPATGDLAGEVVTTHVDLETQTVVTREVVDDIPADVREKAIVYHAVVSPDGVELQCPEDGNC